MGCNKSVRLCIVQKTFWINFDGSLICFDNIAHLTIKGNSIRSRGKNKLTLLLVPGCEEQCLHNICCSNSLDIKLLLPEIYHTVHTFSTSDYEKSPHWQLLSRRYANLFFIENFVVTENRSSAC